jgi:hypothetical protein
VELTKEQEQDIEKIIATLDCPEDLRCYKLKFEDVTPVEVRAGNEIIECQKTDASSCPMSFVFGMSSVFCKCPLRRYVALRLGK